MSATRFMADLSVERLASTGRCRGAGGFWAFWSNWSAKLEYDFYDFGARRVNFVDIDGLPVPADIEQRIHTVKFGINYRFGWGKGKAPIVARY
jgi:outer membrane immunogenic protein